MIFLCCFNTKKYSAQNSSLWWMQPWVSGKKISALALIEAIYFVLTKDDEKVKCKQRRSLASCYVWVRDSFIFSLCAPKNVKREEKTQLCDEARISLKYWKISDSSAPHCGMAIDDENCTDFPTLFFLKIDDVFVLRLIWVQIYVYEKCFAHKKKEREKFMALSSDTTT
jgi:hypothetical protein